MRQIRVLFKSIVFTLLVLTFFLLTLPASTILKKFSYIRYAVIITSFCSRLMIFAMGFRVRTTGDRNLFKRGELVVANHVSYMDVLVLAAHSPSCFVTSYEIRDTPFLGWLCRLGGCLFVERRSRNGLQQEISELTTALKNKLNVVIFPEATSTDGTAFKRFRRPLYRAAIEAKTRVVPITINYLTIDNNAYSVMNRDLICWYGDMTFLPHLLKLFAQKEVSIELNLGLPLKTENVSEAELARVSQDEIWWHYTPVLVPGMGASRSRQRATQAEAGKVTVAING
jgi:1-acyl-sn-glycerol-3-phosphate acyltransferase